MLNLLSDYFRFLSMLIVCENLVKPHGNFPIKATPRFYLLSLISGEMISVANLKVARSCWTQQTLMHLCLNLLGSVLLIRKSLLWR